MPAGVPCCASTDPIQHVVGFRGDVIVAHVTVRIGGVTIHNIGRWDGSTFREIKIQRVYYDEVNHRVALFWQNPDWVDSVQQFRITINGSRSGVVGIDGELLDLDHDGQPGGDAVESGPFDPNVLVKVARDRGQIQITLLPIEN